MLPRPFSELSFPPRFDKTTSVHETTVSTTPGTGWETWVPPGLETAVAERRASGAAGRFAAHLALQAAGATSTAPLARGTRGEPLWPTGFVGSITHTETFAAAAAVASSRARGLGIDSEKIGRAREPGRLLDRVLHPLEHNGVPGLPTQETDRFFAFVFSAKESVYKALYPLVGKVFWFEAARLSAVRGTRFTVVLEQDLSGEFTRGHELTGTFSESDGFIHTAVLVP